MRAAVATAAPVPASYVREYYSLSVTVTVSSSPNTLQVRLEHCDKKHDHKSHDDAKILQCERDLGMVRAFFHFCHFRDLNRIEFLCKLSALTPAALTPISASHIIVIDSFIMPTRSAISAVSLVSPLGLIFIDHNGERNNMRLNDGQLAF